MLRRWIAGFLAVAVLSMAVASWTAVVLLVDQGREREQQAQQAEHRAATLGVCIVELLLVKPGERTLSQVRRVCPEGVVDLMLDVRDGADP